MRIASQVPSISWVKPFIGILESQTKVDLKRITIVNSIKNFFIDLRLIFIQNVADYLRGKQSAEETMNGIVSSWIKFMKA